MKLKRIACFFLALMCVACALSSCMEDEKSSKSVFAMDTYMTLTVYGSSHPNILLDAEKILTELDENFSISSVSGEIGRLNENGYITDPSPELLQILTLAKTLYERSGGLYDITAYALSQLWRECEEQNRVPSAEEIEVARSKVGMDKLIFNENEVRLNGLAGVDLGSIVKGYAGDKIKELYKEQGASGLLDLGGNIVTVGAKRNRKTFEIGVTDPFNPEGLCGTLSVSETNVVTSGKYNRNFTVDGVQYHHIIDVRSGMPCENGVESVTVVCEDGMMADALSTMLFLLGKDGALEYYREHGGFDMILICEGETLVTAGIVDVFDKYR